MEAVSFPFCLGPWKYIGGLCSDSSSTPLSGATWYEAGEIGDGLLCTLRVGALAQAAYLTADFLLGGDNLAVFELVLQEGEGGRAFHLSFGLLAQCSARLRMPMEAVLLNRWRYEREGALLKPICSGSRVDLARVDRVILKLLRKGPQPVRWCMTPVTATEEEPPPLKELVLPRGRLLDEFGQSGLRHWPGKTLSEEALQDRLQGQWAGAPGHAWPAGYSPWGGCSELRLDATGFFRTHHDGRRWWLVDPAGYLFWSVGIDCVRPIIDANCVGLESALDWLPEADGPYAAAISGTSRVNFLGANFIRAFGPHEWSQAWERIVVGEMRRLGFNTVANWSEWQVAQAAALPYVRPLNLSFPTTPLIFRDFPDVFHPNFAHDARTFAQQLTSTAGDPALIGYFLTNEPTWGFAAETPAAAMLYTTEACATRSALADFLRQRYGSDEALANAWGMPLTLERVARGRLKEPLTEAAQGVLAEFSQVIVTKLWGDLSAACRRVDPNHLNLGVRYAWVDERNLWAVRGLRCFDVFSINCYDRRVRAKVFGKISALLERPVLIGEWHFGALDVGLPASGIGHVPSQAARGQAYRVYLEDAAAQPWCVGTHYFQLYDQPAVGRHDGENYNIGFYDVCNRPYPELAAAARASHERLYQLVRGALQPYRDEPAYLPRLF